MSWIALRSVGGCLSTIGVIANLSASIILFKKDSGFSSHLLVFIKHQVCVDALVCFFSLVILTQPEMWMTSIKGIDVIICHVWHSQMVYWIFFYVSMFNVMATAVDRYYSICKPLIYQSWNKNKVYFTIPLMYLVALSALVPTCIEIKTENNTCINAYLLDNQYLIIYNYYMAIETLFCISIPAIVMILSYSFAIRTLYIRRKSRNLGTSRIINKASDKVLKCAVTVTICYILCTTYEFFRFILSHFHVFNYNYGTLQQLIGFVLAMSNCVINPFIYAIFMRRFRRNLFQLINFRYCISENPRRQESSSNVTRETSYSVSQISYIISNNPIF